MPIEEKLYRCVLCKHVHDTEVAASVCEAECAVLDARRQQQLGCQHELDVRFSYDPWESGSFDMWASCPKCGMYSDCSPELFNKITPEQSLRIHKILMEGK